MNETRPGTSSEGDDYEYLLPALLSLQFILKDEVTNFTLQANVKNFGALDDLIINIKTNDDKYNFAIQLKHKSNVNKKLQIAALEPKKDGKNKEKGDFNLRKYYQDYKKLGTEIQNSYNFIIFTNIGLERERAENSQLNEINILPDKICPGLDLINTGTNDGNFGFGAKSDQGFNEFLSKCFLLTQQMTVSELQHSIRRLCENNLKMDEVLCLTFTTQYIDYFKKWHQNRFYNCKIDRELVLIKIVDLLLTPHIISPQFCNNDDVNYNYYYKLIEDAICNFQLTIVDINLGQIELNWKTITELNDVDIIIRAKKLNLLENKQTVSNLTDLIKTKVISFDSQLRRPIFVKLTQENQQSLEIVVKFIDKKPLSLVFFGKFCHFDDTKIKVFHHMETLADNNPAIYSKIISTCFLSLQGRKNISLEELFAYDKNLQKLITLKEIINAELFGKRLLGEEQEQLPTSYVPRCVAVRIFDRQIIKNINDLVVIDCNIFYENIVDYIKNVVKRKFQTINEYINNPENDVQILLTHEFSYEEFGTLIKKYRGNIHRFVAIKCDQLQWLQTQGSSNQLKNKKHTMNLINEREIFEKFQNTTNVVCAVPGMGKSTFLKNLKNNCPPDYWTFKIEYNSIKKLFQNSSINLQQLIENCFEICTKNYSEVAKMICKNYLKRKKVIFFWDALDELRSKSLINNALEYAAAFHKEGYKQWISSRVNLLSIIEDRLQLFTINITEFTLKEQQNYIENRLITIKSKEEIDEIIMQLYQTITMISTNQILGIPLQLHMITEIILQSPNKSPADFTELQIVTKLYKRFFKAKCDLYYKQIDDPADVAVMFNDSFNKYQIAAVLTYFKAEHLALALDEDMLDELNQDFKNILKEFKDKGKKEGVIINVNVKRSFVIFEHNTYGEYFAAAWMAKNFKKRFMVKFSNFIFNEDYRNIRYLFDMILAENSPILLKILQGEEVNEIPVGIKDQAGRTGAHLVCSWGVQHVLSVLPTFIAAGKQINLITDINLDESKIRHNIKMGNKASSLKYEKDRLFQWSPLQYAETLKSLAIIEGLQITSEDFEKMTLVKYCPQIVWYSLKYNYKNILIILSQQLNELYFASKDYNPISTSLMVAIEYEQFDVIKYLVEEVGVDINELNTTGESALWLSVAYKTPLELIKYLIANGADVNWTSNDGTPLIRDMARYAHNLQVLCYMIEDLIDINMNIYDNKPLIYYVIYDNKPLEFIKYLVNRGANLDLTGNFDYLIAAIERSSFQTVEYLVEKIKFNIEDNDSFGNTALSVAVKMNRPKIAKYLIEKGGNINWSISSPKSTILIEIITHITHYVDVLPKIINKFTNFNEINSTGYSALAIAIQWRKNTEIVKLLLKIENIDVHWRHPTTDQTLLMYAVSNGDLEIVQILIEKFRLSVNDIDKYGHPVIYFGINHKESKNSINILRYLIGKGADLKFRKPISGKTILMCAIAKKSYETIKMLIEEYKVDINAPNNEQSTALTYAIRIKSSIQIMKYLIERGAESDCRSFHHIFKVLKEALVANDSTFIEFIVRNLNFNINEGDKNDYSILYYAIRQCKAIDISKILIRYGANISWIHPKNGQSLLIAAISCNNLEALKLIIEKSNFLINQFDNFGDSALSFAIRTNKSLAIIEILVKNGGDVYWRHKETQETLLILAIQINNLKIIEYLCTNFELDYTLIDYEGNSALNHSIKRSINIATYLINKNNANWSNPITGETLLITAIIYKKFKTVQFLIEDCSININKLNKFGYSALTFALKSLEMTKYLVKKGADITWKCRFTNESILILAIKEQCFQTIKYLIENCNCNINHCDDYGNNCLFHAIYLNSLEILKYLLTQKSQQYELKNRLNGLTLLMVAVKENNFKITKYLIEIWKMNINDVDNNGHSALSYSILSNNNIITKYLLDNGANIQWRHPRKNDFTILALAISRGNLEIVQYLLENIEEFGRTIEQYLNFYYY